jgi:hypothetical protein
VTAADDETPRLEHLVSQAADLFVYAPIGLFFEGPSIVAKLAEQGRARADNARLFGQFAVRHGRAELRRRVGGLEEQAVGVLRLLGVLPDDPEPADAPPPRATAAALAAAPAPSGNGQADPGPSVEDLAITDYDSLSASQVVTRLEGLTPEELEAVRAYELAHRGRKTILNKVAQLQA